MSKRFVRMIMAGVIICMMTAVPHVISATDKADKHSLTAEKEAAASRGGGYAVTGQIKETGYICEIYDELTGFPHPMPTASCPQVTDISG